MKLFQLYEDDLAALEQLLPAILQTNPTIANDTATRMKLRRVKEILSNVRWDYGPYSEITKLPADDIDKEPNAD